MSGSGGVVTAADRTPGYAAPPAGASPEHSAYPTGVVPERPGEPAAAARTDLPGRSGTPARDGAGPTATGTPPRDGAGPASTGAPARDGAEPISSGPHVHRAGPADGASRARPAGLALETPPVRPAGPADGVSAVRAAGSSGVSAIISAGVAGTPRSDRPVSATGPADPSPQASGVPASVGGPAPAPVSASEPQTPPAPEANRSAPAPAPEANRNSPAPEAERGDPAPASEVEAMIKDKRSGAAANRSAPVPETERSDPAPVGAGAGPGAAMAGVVRRKNVIGAETTGSIPVHLLFRDGPSATLPPTTGDDDGGPDTVAMAAPVPGMKGRGSVIPTLSVAATPSKGGPAAAGPHSRTRPKPQAKAPAPTSSSRPAPTADPDLVERPASVLPGWIGVVGGALALAWCAAVVWWAGAVPAEAARMLRLPERPYHGVHLGQWALLALGVVLVLFALGGLGRGRVGYAWVLTLFGDYRGTVRRTGLVWVSPLLLRRRVDVRLRHWRSEPLSAVDAKGTALDVVVLVVWRVRDTVRAALGVDGHEDYLREQVEAAMARVLSQLPADAFHEDAPTLRDAEAVGEALTRVLSAECAPVGVDVFSAQPTRIEYAPEVAAAMRRRRIAAIDAKHRDSVLTSVVDAVDDVVHRLTSRGLVELDDYERKALVKDLTVAFYTGRTGPVEGA
ncbi:SPFH domain-containing protein [Streptomyces sp. NPDC058667]|uniref:SPFH domain-containing protein n=1 Tax=Streptomyces sp. NPDC058667 TaxID=3346588 RepID=UPI003666AEF8